jgi:hypothetical protein
MRTLSVLLLCLCLASCQRDSAGGGVISRAGTYASPDSRHALLVTETGSGIINYSVSDAAGTAVASGGGFSAHHRWFFYWDSQNRLWTYNSDMGPFAVHEESASSDWRVSTIDVSSPLLASIPLPVRDNLPDTMKRLLKLDSGGPASAP